MSFTWLRTFHPIAPHRGFTSAARALGEFCETAPHMGGGGQKIERVF
jgi:hypothetical protein